MGDRQGRIQVRVDAYTRTCLTVIAVLLTVLALGLWAETAPWADRALGVGAAAATPAAGIPDAGAQRERMLKEAEKTNAKLDQLLQLLQSGKVKVQLAGKDGKDGGGNPSEK